MSDKTKDARIVHGGRTYARATPHGPLLPCPDGPPDVLICRRLVDFPGGTVPAGGAIGQCTDCGRPIVFIAARVVAAPTICMQCAGIEPLPFETPPHFG